MEQFVRRHRQVVRVTCGHIHRPIYLAWAGTIASISPSPCHQCPLNLTEHGGLLSSVKYCDIPKLETRTLAPQKSLRTVTILSSYQ